MRPSRPDAAILPCGALGWGSFCLSLRLLIAQVGAVMPHSRKPLKAMLASPKDEGILVMLSWGALCRRPRGPLRSARLSWRGHPSHPALAPPSLSTLLSHLLILTHSSRPALGASSSRKSTLTTPHPGLVRGSTSQGRLLGSSPSFVTP